MNLIDLHAERLFLARLGLAYLDDLANRLKSKNMILFINGYDDLVNVAVDDIGNDVLCLCKRP